MSWERIQIQTAQGHIHEAICPVVISASRATDIPAFRAQWFLDKLKNGYVEWRNPFNGKEQYVSFSKAQAFVFWSKNPAPLIPYLNLLDSYCSAYYLLYTLNNYEAERYEPGVPSIEKRVATFCQLSDRLGKERVLWRFDPLLLSASLSLEELLFRIKTLGDALCRYTDKLIFSFIDIEKYRSVRARTRKADASIREFTFNEKLYVASRLQEYLHQWQKHNPAFQIVSCAQEVDLHNYEIEHNACVDYLLLEHIGKHDPELQFYLQCNARVKDKGQRKFCKCYPSKDIGAYNSCGYSCVYCYAKQ